MAVVRGGEEEREYMGKLWPDLGNCSGYNEANNLLKMAEFSAELR